MNKLQIKIDTPCHEDWDKMLPSELGKFCNSCNKQVVDFTEFSDAQLLEYFKVPQPSVCGRTREDQLQRTIVPGRVWRFSFSRWLTAILLLLSAGRARAQHGEAGVVVTQLTGPGTEPVFAQSADGYVFRFELVGGALAEDTGVRRICVKSDVDSQNFYREADNRFHIEVPNWSADSVLEFQFYDSRDLLIGTYPIAIKDAYKYADSRIELRKLPEVNVRTNNSRQVGLVVTVGAIVSSDEGDWVGSRNVIKSIPIRSDIRPATIEYNPQDKMPVNVPGKVLNGSHDMPGVGEPPASKIDRH